MPITGELTFPNVPARIGEHNQDPGAHSIRIENDLTNPTAGMAADAKAVKDLVDNVSGEIDANIDDLDEQVTDLKSALDNFFEPQIAFNKDTSSAYVNSGVYLKDDGSLGTGDNWNITKYIPLESGKTYKYSGLTVIGTNPRACFYTSDRTFITNKSFQALTGTSVIEVPPNASLIKFSVNDADLNTFEILSYDDTTLPEILSDIGELDDLTNSLDNRIERDLITIPLNVDVLSNRLVTSTGGYYSSTTGRATEINVSSFDTIRIPGANFVGDYGYCWFNSSNEPFGYTKLETTGLITLYVPTNAVRLRTCWKVTDYETITDEFQATTTKGAVAYNTMKDDVSKWLNVREPGIENSAWSWWTYPQVECEKLYRNKAYFGEVNTVGIAGIGSVDINESDVSSKTNLCKVGKDDHNGMAVYKNKSGSSSYTFIAFGFTHNEDNYIRQFIGVSDDNGDLYGNPIMIEFPDKTTYAQVFNTKSSTTHTENKILLITRVNITEWWGVYSNNYYGNTGWGTPKPIIKADRQYYAMFRETTTDGLLRIVMYSNPNLTRTDTRIRMGFLDMSNGRIYDADGTTLLGSMDTGGVSYTDFSIVVDIPNYDTSQSADAENELRNRLLDVAITAPDQPYIAYARFTGTNDAEYYVYRNGTTVDVTACGEPFYYPSVYVGGLVFVPNNPDVIYLSRKVDSPARSRIEKWTYSNGSYSLDSEIDRSTNNSVVCIRPIIDKEGTILVYQKGVANVNNFEHYNYDAKVHVIS